MDTPNNQNYNTSAPWFITWMIISIVQLLMCNVISGAITLVLVLLGDVDYKQGKIAEAEHKKKIATIATIIGVIVTVITYILCVIIFLISMNILASY